MIFGILSACTRRELENLDTINSYIKVLQRTYSHKKEQLGECMVTSSISSLLTNGSLIFGACKHESVMNSLYKLLSKLEAELELLDFE